ncbi:hypothetical protein Ancab_029364 [Ancistrocladus abbreviatus]
MSAIVCGKRSFFEELPSSATPVSKKLRCSSSSPVRFSPFSSPPRNSLVDQLRETFPHMDQQLLEQALEECGDDINSAIKRLQELCLSSSEDKSAPVSELEKKAWQGNLDANGGAIPTDDPAARQNLPADGGEWVELFVREMMSATSVDDARTRASRVLEVLEKSITARAHAEAADSIQKENIMLKEQNAILKQAVVIQHERLKEYDDMNQEVQHLKELVSQYQQQLSTLEVNNYTLRMHLQQAQQSSSIPGQFNPDVF